MKNIKTLLIILLGFLSVAGMAADTLYVRFNNYYVKDGPTNDTMIFDVEFKSFTAGTYLTVFQLDIQYNTAVFGTYALPVSIETLDLVTGAFTVAPAPNNPTSNSFRFSKSVFPFPAPALNTLALVPTNEYAGVARFKMLIQDNSQGAGLLFRTTMNSNQKFVKTVTSTFTTYSPNSYKNNLTNFPTTPTVMDLMLTEIADPAGNGDFVEIYNAGDAAVDFTNIPWYLTRYNGVTYANVKLAGTLAAGDVFVIGGTGYAYTGKPSDQTSTVVDGTGNLDMFLTMYNPYLDGMVIDLYEGNGYTGGHAVRLYDVDAPAATFDAMEWSELPGEPAAMTPGSHKQTLTWEGDSGSDWLNNDNWATSYVPDAGHNAVIPNTGETIPIVSAGSNATAFDLSIGGAGAGLVVASDMTNGDGSLVTYGTVTGTASVQRYLGADRYYYVSKPVTSATAGVFLHCWLFTYNEVANSWDPFIMPEATPLGDMQGYAVWTSSDNSWDPTLPPIGDTTVAYEGLLNTGDMSKALTYSIDGWNFTGNPYPSAVNWEDDDWTKTGLVTDAYSVYDGTTYGTYTAGSGGTNGTTEIIPAAQGFFVQVNAAGTLGLGNGVRTHSTLDFWKSEELMSNRLSLTISNGQESDETVIYFNENATTDLDYAYDASKLMAMGAPQAYTMLGDREMAINTFNNTTETAAVTLGINAPENTAYTLTASNIESFDGGTPIYLEDQLTGAQVNLRENASYNFNSGEGMSSRFIVHFTAPQGIGNPGNTEVNGVYAYNRNVYVNFNGTSGEIVLYNILGQEVSRTQAGNGLNVIPVAQGDAVYIVKVISDNVNVTKKVFVK